MSSPLLIAHGSKAWSIAFVAALSESKLYEDLARYARERARLVQRFRAVGDGYVDDLVQDAIDDTFLGILEWNPNAIDLFRHLPSVIRSRTHHDLRRAKRFPHDVDPDELADLETGEREALRRRAQEVLDAFRALAAGDTHVLLLLAAYDEAVTRRAEVLALTGLTRHEYEAARHRLARLRNDIPSRLLFNK